MAALLQWLFFVFVVRPLALIVLGLNVRHRERLPDRGPVILVANHNSHLDTLILMTLFPLRLLPKLRPVAAADYFLRSGLVAWFSTRILGIIPIPRKGRHQGRHPLEGCFKALDENSILILFPEGSRGEPETLSEFKSGVAHLVAERPNVPVVPIFLHGLGKALPRGEAILVPFFCDIFVGETLPWNGSRESFMMRLNEAMRGLSHEGKFASWD